MKPQKTIRDQKGAALVEFAIVLVVLALIAFGICEFGLLVYNKHVISNGSREGARVGIVSGTDYTISDDVKQVVIDYCTNRLINFSGSADVAAGDIVLAPAGDGARQAAVFGTDFSVTVRWDYGYLLPSLFGLGNTTEITARTLMKKEQTI